MALETTFSPLALEDVPRMAAERKEGGWRYVQTLAVNTEDGIDLLYSFMKDGVLENLRVSGVKKGTAVPSITDKFLAAFVFENEIHDLFGVQIENIAIDFKGKFYALAEKEPMTVFSPAQLAAREKAAKIAAAKAAKEKAAAAGEAGDGAKATPADAHAELEAKLAGMDPEKAAKVRAAMEAKAKKEAAKKDAELEAKLKDMDPEKAARVRAAMEAKAKKAAAAAAKEGE